MLKLIKQAHNDNVLTETYAAQYTANITEVAKQLNQPVVQINEAITHVLANISNSVQNGQPVNVDLAYGRHDTLAAFLAGVEFLATRPRVSDGTKRFFAAVAIRNGQMTHLDAVAKVGQIGNEKNSNLKQALTAAIDAYNQGDVKSGQLILNTIGKIRNAVDKSVVQQSPTQPQTSLAM